MCRLQPKQLLTCQRGQTDFKSEATRSDFISVVLVVLKRCRNGWVFKMWWGNICNLQTPAVSSLYVGLKHNSATDKHGHKYSYRLRGTKRAVIQRSIKISFDVNFTEKWKATFRQSLLRRLTNASIRNNQIPSVFMGKNIPTSPWSSAGSTELSHVELTAN